MNKAKVNKTLKTQRGDLKTRCANVSIREILPISSGLCVRACVKKALKNAGDLLLRRETSSPTGLKLLMTNLNARVLNTRLNAKCFPPQSSSVLPVSFFVKNFKKKGRNSVPKGVLPSIKRNTQRTYTCKGVVGG